ncbi:hypothetical protein NC652_026692 [Populus alba x Populus x berolinensis]|uniref:Uncharacterized protein n=1 Tax=Populus alba x Populus x berolinensis TaxID=444605 RepID=A0AAD6MD79_9ROSI|nr:hypothetical protein NC652_026692 [Populus alba x Populus x berolinensis]KAJ6983398.1 hypothetical protein NC653_026260 [Populus alba x Populus x berolinensis]
MIRTCTNDAVCIPYCPKSCKRVYCDKQPYPYQSRCFCQMSGFSLRSILISMPCVQGVFSNGGA